MIATTCEDNSAIVTAHLPFENWTEVLGNERHTGAALYNRDERAGEVLRDSSGNNHHGKIMGAKWVKVDSSAATEHVDLLDLIDPEKHAHDRHTRAARRRGRHRLEVPARAALAVGKDRPT